jgi:hypothetical protein
MGGSPITLPSSLGSGTSPDSRYVWKVKSNGSRQASEIRYDRLISVTTISTPDTRSTAKRDSLWVYVTSLFQTQRICIIPERSKPTGISLQENRARLTRAGRQLLPSVIPAVSMGATAIWVAGQEELGRECEREEAFSYRCCPLVQVRTLSEALYPEIHANLTTMDDIAECHTRCMSTDDDVLPTQSYRIRLETQHQFITMFYPQY